MKYCLLLIFCLSGFYACEDPVASQNESYSNAGDDSDDMLMNQDMQIQLDQLNQNDSSLIDATLDQDSVDQFFDMYQSQPMSTVMLTDDHTQLMISYQGGFEMSWQGYEQEYLHFDVDSIRIGWTEARDPLSNYDPYPLILGSDSYVNPNGLVWTSVRDAELIDHSDSHAVLHLTMSEGYRVALNIYHEEEGRLSFRLQALTHQDTQTLPFIAFFEINPRMQQEDFHEIYGLGEWYDQIVHKGKIRVMHLTLDDELEQGYNEVHAPIPYLSSSQGWGMFFESDAPTVFDVAHTQADRIKVVLATENTIDPQEASYTNFHLFASQHPLDLNRHYYQITGWPRMPAPWALGPWIWRDEHDDQAQVESDLQLIRDLDLPTSGYWIDRPYDSAVGAFDFETRRFPNPESIAEMIKNLGFKLALWHAPYIDREEEATAALYQEVIERGFMPSQAGLLLNTWSTPIDFTQEEARRWWQDKLSYYRSLGVIGYKLDYAEDIVVGLNGRRIPWQFADGSTELTMHNQYQRLYHQVYADTLGEDGGFLICRTARWGDQVNLNIMWPADLDADFSRFKERKMTEDGDEYGAVGGIPAALSAGLSLSASGFPFYASDTGGYRHAPPDKETFMRWLELSALGTVMQTGTSTNDVPWEFTDDNGFDEQVLNTYRLYARLHIRLFPYKWTYAQELKSTGSARPLMRPLGLAYPNAQLHVSDTYLLGEEILVAPVIERDARSRSVYLPAGQWVHWWDHSIWNGEQTHQVDAPIDQIPLFVKVGSLIPMLRPHVDTLSPVVREDPSSINTVVDSFADDAGLLWTQAFGIADIEGERSHSFTVYDDSQLTLNHNEMGVSLGYQAGSVFNQGIVFVVTGLDTVPEGLQVNGMDMLIESQLDSWEALVQGAYYEQSTQTLYLKHSDTIANFTWMR